MLPRTLPSLILPNQTPSQLKNLLNVMVSSNNESLLENSTKLVDLRSVLGTDESKPTLVAIKGTVFDVTGNASYAAKGPYRGMMATPLTFLHKHAPPFVCDTFKSLAARSLRGPVSLTSTIRHLNNDARA